MPISRIFSVLLACLCGVAALAAPVRVGVALPADGATTAALDRAQAQGARAVRLQADWPRLQPTSGTWNFAWLDTQVAAAAARGLEVTLVFGPAPTWAVTYLDKPTDEQARRALPDAKAYKAYVDKVVRHYRDRVSTYQVWERPTATTLLAAQRDVLALFASGGEAVHAVSPTLRVIAPEPGGVDLSWTADYLKVATGAKRADVIALAPRDTTPAALWWQISVLRDRVLPANGPALTADLSDGAGTDCTAAALLLQNIGSLTLAADADLPRWLCGLQGTSYTGWTTPAAGSYGGVFTGGGATTVLCVPAAGGPVTVTTGAPATTNPGTPCVTPSPVTGDQVTLDLTGQNPAGIHPLPQLPGGHYMVVPHGDEMVLETTRNTAPWIYMDVPDGFLFYNSARVPVEVTVRVLGARTAQRSGFSLYYDAVGGMKNSPWQWIEVGPSQVFTYTLRLDDALMSNRGGYDFRLNMGGSDEPLRLVGITVRKLQ